MASTFFRALSLTPVQTTLHDSRVRRKVVWE